MWGKGLGGLPVKTLKLSKLRRTRNESCFVSIIILDYFNSNEIDSILKTGWG